MVEGLKISCQKVVSAARMTIEVSPILFSFVPCQPLWMTAFPSWLLKCGVPGVLPFVLFFLYICTCPQKVSFTYNDFTINHMLSVSKSASLAPISLLNSRAKYLIDY